MSINESIQKIKESTSLDLDSAFTISKLISTLFLADSTQHEARKLFIYVLDNLDKFPKESIEIWNDISDMMGFYPYLQRIDQTLTLDTSTLLRTMLHHSESLDLFFHSEQKIIADLITQNKNVVVSAPTSFGKSLLIENVVSQKLFTNIVIIQPTLALLDETRKKLTKYKDYRIVVRTSQKPLLGKNNIFLLTAERVIEYDHFENIDLLIIDEFYKLSQRRDDERFESLNNAFNKILRKYKPQFYLLGPNIEGISEEFIEKYNATFHKTDYSLVEVESIDIDTKKLKTNEKEQKLFELLDSFGEDEQTIVYCASPGKVRKLSVNYYNHLLLSGLKNANSLPLIEWIEENVSKNWDLVELLSSKIGIHDGALQKHISSTIIDYFNNGDLSVLFCTSTIIEGVNTSAKNVIYFDKKKGGNPIDYFDYSNIKGRAGRLMQHYIGRIYNFNPTPKQDKFIVDIPFFEQNEPVPKEILINIQEKDIKNKQSDNFLDLQSLDNKTKEVLRTNAINIDGQRKIIKYLIENFDNRITINDRYLLVKDLIAWSGYPDYEQILFFAQMCWENLKKKNESKSIYSYSQLAYYISTYNSNSNLKSFLDAHYQSLLGAKYTGKAGWQKRYKNMTDEQILQSAIRDVFQIFRHWFEYKIPKWLQVMNNIQIYICEIKGYRPGNYNFYINNIENGFSRGDLAILEEYGIPRSAIRKLEKQVPEQINDYDVIDYIRENSLIDKANLLEYERIKLLELLN